MMKQHINGLSVTNKMPIPYQISYKPSVCRCPISLLSYSSNKRSKNTNQIKSPRILSDFDITTYSIIGFLKRINEKLNRHAISNPLRKALFIALDVYFFASFCMAY